jgi:peptide/nickel transport system substrate-binding protein
MKSDSNRERSTRTVRLRALLVAVVGLGLVLAVAGVPRSRAASAAAPIPLLRVAIDSPLSNLNLAVAAGGYTGMVEDLAVEQLMKRAGDGSIQPGLARSVTQPGPAVYVYHLRQGVKFWDGSELTSTDVANAMNYYRYPGTQLAHYYASVKSITTPGRYTVVVTLKHRDASWPLVTSEFANIFQKKFEDAHKKTMGQPGVLMMGTGPFEFDSFDPTSGVEMSANPHYWGGPVDIRHVSVKFFSDETSAALAFRAGEIDLDPYITGPKAYAATANVKITSVPSCGEDFYSMNFHVAPWNDVHVRRAVAYATDRQGIITAGGAVGTPIQTILPPIVLRSLGSQAAVTALLKSVPNYPFSLAKAKAELAKSAYPHGFSFTLDSYQGPIVNEEQVLGGDLAKIGITMKINPEPIGTWLAEVFGPRDKIGMIYSGLGCSSSDPSFIVNLFLPSKQAKAGALNVADYTNATVDGLITAGLSTTNLAKRLAIYGRILQQIQTDVPYVGVYSPAVNMALNPKYTWSDYNAYSPSGTWLLGVKRR